MKIFVFFLFFLMSLSSCGRGENRGRRANSCERGNHDSKIQCVKAQEISLSGADFIQQIENCMRPGSSDPGSSNRGRGRKAREAGSQRPSTQGRRRGENRGGYRSCLQESATGNQARRECLINFLEEKKAACQRD